MAVDIANLRLSNRAKLGILIEAKRRLQAKQTVKTLWTPDPRNKPQIAGYGCEADELFYGGAAGSGKSDLLLGLALTSHRRSIIFRRLYTDIKALEDRSKEILENVSTASFNGQEHRWRGLPGDRSVEFGSMKLENDKRKYQGQAHD